MEKVKRTLQQTFKVLESLLLAKRELLKNQGVSLTELDSLICVEAELLVNGFNEVILKKYDKKTVDEKTVDEKTADKKSEMPCNSHEEKVELKPCPFCGNKDLEIIPAGKGDNESMSMYQRIYCSVCQTMFKQMVDGSPEYLVQCWNTRNAEVAKAD